MELTLRPEALDAVERRLKQLEGESRQLGRKARSDRVAATCQQDMEEEMEGLRKQREALGAVFEGQKAKVGYTGAN